MSKAKVPPCPPQGYTRLDGYLAVHIALEDLLNHASRTLPTRVNQKSANFRAGYYRGLAAASALLALGEHPQHNATEIKKLLKR